MANLNDADSVHVIGWEGEGECRDLRVQRITDGREFVLKNCYPLAMDDPGAVDTDGMIQLTVTFGTQRTQH